MYFNIPQKGKRRLGSNLFYFGIINFNLFNTLIANMHDNNPKADLKSQ